MGEIKEAFLKEVEVEEGEKWNKNFRSERSERKSRRKGRRCRRIRRRCGRIIFERSKVKEVEEIEEEVVVVVVGKKEEVDRCKEWDTMVKTIKIFYIINY